jgi:molybdopterin converting factor subunit 1
MSYCKLLFFANLKDRTGVRQAAMELPAGISVREFKTLLESEFPAIKPLLPNALIAVNHEYALDDTLIPPEAEIALFPPVSGG